MALMRKEKLKNFEGFQIQVGSQEALKMREQNNHLLLEIDNNLRVIAELVDRLSFVNREINSVLKPRNTDMCA